MLAENKCSKKLSFLKLFLKTFNRSFTHNIADLLDISWGYESYQYTFFSSTISGKSLKGALWLYRDVNTAEIKNSNSSRGKNGFPWKFLTLENLYMRTPLPFRYMQLTILTIHLTKYDWLYWLNTFDYIDDIHLTILARFNSIDSTFDYIDSSFDSMNSSFGSMTQHLTHQFVVRLLIELLLWSCLGPNLVLLLF